ncbi:unnamed protein product, partial [Polarella glacialis]
VPKIRAYYQQLEGLRDDLYLEVELQEGNATRRVGYEARVAEWYDGLDSKLDGRVVMPLGDGLDVKTGCQPFTLPEGGGPAVVLLARGKCRQVNVRLARTAVSKEIEIHSGSLTLRSTVMHYEPGDTAASAAAAAQPVPNGPMEKQRRGLESVLDVKYIDKPEKFDNSRKSWLEWRFKMHNWLSLIDPRIDELLDVAAASLLPIKPQADDDMKRMQHIIFAVLSSYLQSSSLRLIQAVKARNGFEAWRVLCKEFEPKTAKRKLSMLSHLLMNPDFGETDEEFLVKWRQWKADIDAYESFVGKPFDTDLMIAVMLNFTPWELRRHLQFNAAQYEDSYQRLEDLVISYLQSKQLWTDLEEEHEAHDRGGHRPMEVDEIEATVKKLTKGQDAGKEETRDAGKDAGKEETSNNKGQVLVKQKEKVKEDICYKCGNKGHYARDCRAKPWNYKINELQTYQEEPVDGETPAWVLLMCADEDEDTSLQQISAHGDEVVATVDSGSPVHACPKWMAPSRPLLTDRHLKVWSAGGQRIRHYGHKLVDMELEGSPVQMDFDIMDVRRPIVSVVKMMRMGHKVVFETGKCHIGRPDRGILPMHEMGDVCVLRGKVVEEGSRHLQVMPVEAEAEPRPIPQREGPASLEERMRRNLVHLPFRSWCQVCIRARAREDPHGARQVGQETLEQPALVQMDYTFMEKLKLLTAYLLDHGYGAATVVQSKGPELYAISWLLKLLDQLGLEDVMLHIDPEAALRAVAEKIRAMRQKKTLIQEAPVRSPQSIGGVSRYQRSLQEQIRALRLQLQESLNSEIGVEDAIVTWMVRHAAWLLARFAPWREGAAPYTRHRGAPYRGKVVQFGEYALAMNSEGYRRGAQRTSKFDSRWLGGVWLGKTGASDEHLVAVSGRVKCFRSLRRLAVEDENRWQSKLIKMLIATPWNMAPAMVSQPSLLTKPTGVVMSARDFPPTPGCPACAKRGQASHGLKHSVRCRQEKQKWMASQLPGPVEVIPQTGQAPEAGETQETQEEAEVEESRRRMRQKTTPPQEESAEVRRGSAHLGGGGGLVEETPVPLDTTATSKRAAAETAQQAQEKKAKLIQALELEGKLEHNDEMAYGDEGLIEGLPADKVMKGIEKELRGLADKGVRLTIQPEDIPDGARQISMRFVNKMRGDDVKSRIVVRDIKRSPPEGGELFASTPSLASFRLHFTLSSLELNLMLQESGSSEEFVEVLGDIGQAFVHANIDQDIYVWPPEAVRGVEVTIDGEKVTLSPEEPWKLRKALYGYRKSPMLWQEHLAQIVTERVKLHRSAIDTSTYFDADRKVLLFVHVDDLALGGPAREVNRVLKLMEETLTVKKVVRLEKPGDAGELLGRRIVRTKKGFQVTHGKAVGDSMLEEFHLQQAHTVTVPAVNYTDKQREEATELPEQPEGDEPSGSNYRRGGGQVMYVAHDRPDLQFAAKEAARAMAKPTSLDVTKLKRIARYLKQYPAMTLVLELEEFPEALTVYVDSDWAGDSATRKSASGGIVMLGDVVLTTWSRTQASVSLSSAEAEYYAITSGAVEAMYVQNLLKEMRRDLPICTDSSAAKASAERHGVQSMKHMQIRLMFLKNLVKEGIVQMQKVKTEENPADMLTKALGQDKLQHCLQLLPGLTRHEAEIGLLEVEEDNQDESNTLGEIVIVMFVVFALLEVYVREPKDNKFQVNSTEARQDFTEAVEEQGICQQRKAGYAVGMARVGRQVNARLARTAVSKEIEIHSGRLESVLDVKYIDKPEKFDNSRKSWLEWRFKMHNWLSLIDPRIDELLDVAAASLLPIKPQADDDMKRMQHIIFAVLSSYLQSSSLRLIQAVKARNGFEAWRVLCKEFEPKTAQRKLSMLSHLLMNPDFGETDEEFLVKWRQWKADIDAYAGRFVGVNFCMLDAKQKGGQRTTRCPQGHTMELACLASSHAVKYVLCTHWSEQRQQQDLIPSAKGP